MPFYVNDWLSSAKVTCMSLEQQGAFMRLLAHCWASQDASLPDDDEQLAALSGMGQGWLNGGCKLVRNCFMPHPDKHGYLTNEKTLSLWRERQQWREKSSEGGRKSAAKRKLQHPKGGSTTVATKRQPNGNSSSSSSSSSLPPSPAPPPASNGGDRDLGLAWKGVEEDLRKCGVALASKAVQSAALNGSTPDAAIDVIAHWRLKPGAWDAGALYTRILNMHPGEDCSEFWPPESPKAQRAQSREESSKSHAKVVNERLEGEVRREQELLQRANREAKFGHVIDAMSREKIERLIRDKFPDDADFFLKRIARSGVTGTVRDSLLSYLESVPQGLDLLSEAPL